MPFRAKMKRALGGGGGGSSSDYDPSNPLTHGIQKKSGKQNYPDNVYKPGEAMPPLKYRGPWNQAHQDKLSAFSFGNAWKENGDRQSSVATTVSDRPGSDYSPMGSKRPSRGNSRNNSGWSTFSFGLRRHDGGRHSFDGGWSGAEEDDFGKSSGMHGPQPRYANGASLVKESTLGDDDVTNVGLSRRASREDGPPSKNSTSGLKSSHLHSSTTKVGNKRHTLGAPPAGAGSLQQTTAGTSANKPALSRQSTARSYGHGHAAGQGAGFSPDDLAAALSHSTLETSRRGEVFG